jgi:hypothetical protein
VSALLQAGQTQALSFSVHSPVVCFRISPGNELNLRTAGRSVDRPSRRSETPID